MFECAWEREGFECWSLRGDLRGASRRWQHRLGDELWLWLNLSGQGVVWGKEHRIFLKPGLFGLFGGQEPEDWKWTRLPGQHEGRILVIPRNYALTLAARGRALDTRSSRWLRGYGGLAFVGLMGATEHRLAGLLAANWRTTKKNQLPTALKRTLDSSLSSMLRGVIRPVIETEIAGQLILPPAPARGPGRRRRSHVETTPGGNPIARESAVAARKD